MQVHSVMADDTGPCEIVVRAAHPRLRPYVIGYSGFRAPYRPDGRCGVASCR